MLNADASERVFKTDAKPGNVYNSFDWFEHQAKSP